MLYPINYLDECCAEILEKRTQLEQNKTKLSASIDALDEILIERREENYE